MVEVGVVATVTVAVKAMLSALLGAGDDDVSVHAQDNVLIKHTRHLQV